MSDYIRNNAKDFEVVIIGVVDAIDWGDFTANQMDEVNYLIDNLGALQDRCTGFRFYGGFFLYFYFVYSFFFCYKRPDSTIGINFTK